MAPTVPGGDTWAGGWVADRLDIAVETPGTHLGIALTDLAGLALRRNPRRAQLLVSRVLGKHVPADPRLVYGSGLLLGVLVRAALAGESRLPGHLGRRLRTALAAGRGPAVAGLPATVRTVDVQEMPAVVLGYAETAT